MGLSRRFVTCWVLFLAALAGCVRKSPPAPSAAAGPVTRGETRRDAYRPPADGKLTPAQVELYFKVWSRIPAPVGTSASGFPKRARGLGDAVEGGAPDVAAAHEIQANVEEYLWVKERILEAEAAVMVARLNSDVLSMLEKTLTDLKNRRAKAPDEPSRALLQEQISNFEAEAERTRRESREKEPDWIRANIGVLQPFRGRLDALQDQIDRTLPAAGGAARSRKALPRKRAS